MRAAIALALVGLLGGCGDDDGSPTDVDGPPALDVDGAAGEVDAAGGGGVDAAAGPDSGGGGALGEAIIDGTVAEQIFLPQAAFYAIHPFGDIPVLVMPDDPSGFCDVSASTDGFDVVIGFPCGAPVVDTLPIDGDPEAACAPGAPHVWVLAEGFEGEFSEYVAVSGMVEVTAIDGEQVVGTFSASFGDKGGLIGSFTAVVCPAT